MQLQDTAGSEAECSGATADEEGEGEGARSLAGVACSPALGDAAMTRDRPSGAVGFNAVWNGSKSANQSWTASRPRACCWMIPFAVR